MSMKPDLVLVQKSVSRIAQELFNKMGVTLVLNVKVSVLERIARCTKAEILTSVDAHMGKPVLGTCKQFYVKKFGNKALMFFEGCPVPERGCSVLLRSNTINQLKILKSILKQLVLMIYNWKFEKSYLMDQFALPLMENRQLNNASLIDEENFLVLSNKNNANEKSVTNQPEFSEVKNSTLLTKTELVNKYQNILNNTILSLSPIIYVSKPNISFYDWLNSNCNHQFSFQYHT